MGLLVAASACYPTGFETSSQTDVVITLQDPEADYGANRTFVVSSTIADLGDIFDPDNNVELDRTNEAFILETITQNMLDLGYVLEDDPDTRPPDVGVFVGAVVSESWYYYWYPGWPGYWPPYPPVYYPPYPVVGNYKVGTLVFPIVKLDPDRGDEEPVQVLWFAAADGLLSGSGGASESRLRQAIDQAFDQSPYLELPTGPTAFVGGE